MEYERLSRIREAIVSFFRLSDLEPGPDNYRNWLTSLDDSHQGRFRGLAYGEGRKLISFQCYWLEQRGYTLDEYLKNSLSNEDFNYCQLLRSALS